MPLQRHFPTSVRKVRAQFCTFFRRALICRSLHLIVGTNICTYFVCIIPSAYITYAQVLVSANSMCKQIECTQAETRRKFEIQKKITDFYRSHVLATQGERNLLLFLAVVENLFNAFSPLCSISIQTLRSHTEATC